MRILDRYIVREVFRHALLELQQYYKQGGGARTDGLLQSLIQRAPVTLDQYLTANAREFRDQAASA